MTLPASGEISLSDIATELQWGGTQDSMDTFTALAIGDSTITDIPDKFSDWYGYTHTQIPPAPSGQSAAEVGNGTDIDINWTDNSGGIEQEDHFRIEFNKNSAGFVFLVNTAQDAVVHTHTTLTCPDDQDDTYIYRIRAENIAGNSAWATTNTVTVQCA